MFKVGDQVHIRGNRVYSMGPYTYNPEKKRSVEIGSVISVNERVWPDKYQVMFLDKPDRTYWTRAECLVRADVQSG